MSPHQLWQLMWVCYIQDTNDKFNIGMSISNVGIDMRLSGKDLYQSIDLDPDNLGNNETIIANLNTDQFYLYFIEWVFHIKAYF